MATQANKLILMSFLLLGLVACPEREIIFTDLESVRQINEGKYAVGDVIEIEISSGFSFLFGPQVNFLRTTAISSNTDTLQIVPFSGIFTSQDLRFRAEVLAEGSVALELTRNNGKVISSITLLASEASDVVFAPQQFNLETRQFESGKLVETLTLFQDGTVKMLSQLQENVAGDLVPLKGQIVGEVRTEDLEIVSVKTQGNLQLGEATTILTVSKEDIGIFPNVPKSFFSLIGENVGTETVTFSANGFTKELLVETFPLDPNLFEILLNVPETSETPVQSDFITAQSFTLEERREIFGGKYVFTEVTAAQELLEIIPVSNDAVLFNAKEAGTASVEVFLLDKANDVVASTIVEINVAP